MNRLEQGISPSLEIASMENQSEPPDASPQEQPPKKKKASSESRAKMSKAAIELWKDPKHREMMSKIRRELWKKPEYRRKMGKVLEKRWQNPAYRKRVTRSLRRRGDKYGLWEYATDNELLPRLITTERVTEDEIGILEQYFEGEDVKVPEKLFNRFSIALARVA